MLHITTDKDGKAKYVSVASDDENYKFPADHAKRTSTNGKVMFIMPVEYDEVELADVTLSEDSWAALLGAQDTTDKQDVIDAMNAGLRLAQGDAVKAQYRVKGEGLKSTVEALTWLLGQPSAVVDEYKAITDAAKAKAWLLGKYKAR